ncbi:MAG TPA: hypothetical protein VEA38_25485, partial [Terriglobales bacterium]|nr:hypothetical protein [Terriglobales bacterium]
QRELVANQVDLDPEAARILRENLWSLLSAAPERPAAQAAKCPPHAFPNFGRERCIDCGATP